MSLRTSPEFRTLLFATSENPLLEFTRPLIHVSHHLMWKEHPVRIELGAELVHTLDRHIDNVWLWQESLQGPFTQPMEVPSAITRVQSAGSQSPELVRCCSGGPVPHHGLRTLLHIREVLAKRGNREGC